MNGRLLFQRLIHLPRRIVRDSLMVFHLVQFFLINRFGRTQVIQRGRPVVSLTTYGSRSDKVYFAIESIANGDVKPSRLILWVDEEMLFNNLPATLRRLQRRGLEVRLCNNYGPHKKYYSYVESVQTLDVPLVTADDDLLYPKYWLKQLVEANREFPEYVNCFWSHVIAVDENGIGKSQDWKQCHSMQPHSCHVAAGGAGAIYPPSFLMALKRAGAAFVDCCPKADDIWLHVQALRSGHKVRQIRRHLPYLSFRGIPGTQDTALCNYNVDEQGNDRQIRATYNEADVCQLRADS